MESERAYPFPWKVLTAFLGCCVLFAGALGMILSWDGIGSGWAPMDPSRPFGAHAYPLAEHGATIAFDHVTLEEYLSDAPARLSERWTLWPDGRFETVLRRRDNNVDLLRITGRWEALEDGIDYRLIPDHRLEDLERYLGEGNPPPGQLELGLTVYERGAAPVYGAHLPDLDARAGILVSGFRLASFHPSAMPRERDVTFTKKIWEGKVPLLDSTPVNSLALR